MQPKTQQIPAWLAQQFWCRQHAHNLVQCSAALKLLLSTVQDCVHRAKGTMRCCAVYIAKSYRCARSQKHNRSQLGSHSSSGAGSMHTVLCSVAGQITQYAAALHTLQKAIAVLYFGNFAQQRYLHVRAYCLQHCCSESKAHDSLICDCIQTYGHLPPCSCAVL